MSATASTTKDEEISPIMPYETKYLNVFGETNTKMAYVESGDIQNGDPILFLHGNPTSKYLWRNIMPHLESQGHVVAPDLIGMGESDKPTDIKYRYNDHYKYLDAFINKKFSSKKDKKILLVIHDWGSGLGFNFAYQNQNRIKGIVFMEAIVEPVNWNEFPPDYKIGFKLMRTPYIGEFLVQSPLNMFVNVILPKAIARSLKKEEHEVYLKPFDSYSARLPTLQWPREIPIDESPKDNYDTIKAYSEWLLSDASKAIPKLMIVATPGGLITEEKATKYHKLMSNITRVDMPGDGIHFIQEDNPHFIGQTINKWMIDKKL